jgi:hypothetical protein
MKLDSADKIVVEKMRKYGASMDVPGRGEVEIPLAMDDMGGLRENGRAERNARLFGNVMDAFGGSGNHSVDFQYQKGSGKTGRGKGV